MKSWTERQKCYHHKTGSKRLKKYELLSHENVIFANNTIVIYDKCVYHKMTFHFYIKLKYYLHFIQLPKLGFFLTRRWNNFCFYNSTYQELKKYHFLSVFFGSNLKIWGKAIYFCVIIFPDFAICASNKVFELKM